MQYRGLRAVAARMGWKSPATVLRRHKMDQFPLYPDWTQRGQIWVTTDALIEDWERKKAELNQGMRLRHPPYMRRHKPSYRPYNYKLRNKNRTSIGTANGTIKQSKKRPLHEELGWDNLDPTTRAWIKNHELTPEELVEIERYEATMQLPEDSIPEPQLNDPPNTQRQIPRAQPFPAADIVRYKRCGRCDRVIIGPRCTCTPNY